MELARRVFVVVGALLLVGLLIFTRATILAPLEKQVSLGRETLLSNPLDLASSHLITWDVPVERWRYREGEAKLSLLVNRSAVALCDVKANSPLRVRVSAIGRLESGLQYDRFVRNWYYTTNEPLSPGAKLWESGTAERLEYGLGAIAIYPFERLRISLDVFTPAPQLAVCNPRLQLVPNIDYAIAEHLPLLRVARDTGLAVAWTIVAGLAWLAWGRSRRPEA